jgi:cysteine desulfurase
MAIASSRSTVATVLNANPEEVYFTSGGTEANNWALNIAAEIGMKNNKRHIISTEFEHPSVLSKLNNLKEQGFDITLLPVHENGIVIPSELKSRIRSDTVLVSVMYVNNEIGTVQPISAIGEICREHDVLFHTDAVQAVGHVAVDVQAEYIDLLSLSAHKFHGTKGIGALYCNKAVPISPFIHGGVQEKGVRAGTENVPAIIGMAAALEEAHGNMLENNMKISAMSDRFINVLNSVDGCSLNGDAKKHVPGILNCCFDGVDGESLLKKLNARGVCVSLGSACASGTLDPSHVLLALGLSREKAYNSLRFSLSRLNTLEDIDHATNALLHIIKEIRKTSEY